MGASVGGPRQRGWARTTGWTAVVLLAACPSADPDPEPTPADWVVEVPASGPLPEDLADLGLFRWDPSTEEFTWNDGVVPYDLNSPLFSDYAEKARALWLPEGGAMTYDGNDAFAFPDGAVLLKNFLLPADLRAPDEDLTLIETRILVKQEGRWQAWPYVWDGDSAALDPSGEVIDVSVVGHDGEPVAFTYLVPQRNQCAQCHELDSDDGRYITPIGPKARHLNRDEDLGDGPLNQLTRFAALGMLDGLPGDGVDVAWDARTTGDPALLGDEDLNEAARDYLDINCAHCHNPAGVNGISSQLFLNHDNENDFNLGICKAPGSAGEGTGGFSYDIVPGNPDESILVYRMVTDELGAIMPLLGRSLVHEEGVALVSEWIRRMEPDDCE